MIAKGTSLAALSILLFSHAASAQSAPPSQEPAHASSTPSAPTTPSTQSAQAAVPQVAPAPSPIPAPTPAELAHRRVAVDVQSTRPDAILERRISVVETAGALIVLPYRGMESTWEQVCVAPCSGVELDRYSSYRVAAANGISASSRFTLPQGTNTLRLDVDAGNLMAHRAGQVLGAAGLAAVIVGASLLVSSTSFKHEDDARTAGWITGGAGIVALGIGIPLALLTRTRVSTPDGRSLAANAGGIAF